MDMSRQPATRALVVDDEPDIRNLVRDILEDEGLEVCEASDGRAALRVLHEERPDLVILDVMMPDLDGWATLERIRDISDVPVIMLTARSLEWERARGLRAGADDYLGKPFSSIELAARVVALMRRTHREDDRPTVYSDDFLQIDFDAREVTVRGEVVSLTPLEFRMLNVFVHQVGKAVGKDDMLEAVWGRRDAVFPEQVKLYVGYLRRKLGLRPDGASPIATIRGFGYMYRPS